jgi:hypothetical protein
MGLEGGFKGRDQLLKLLYRQAGVPGAIAGKFTVSQKRL